MLPGYSFAWASIASRLIWIFIFVGIVILISFLKDSGKKGKKVIFLGDSLTKAGALHGGYIFLIRQILKDAQLLHYNFIASGVNGNKITDIKARLMNDVIAQSPQIVVIWIGVNDVWHKYSHGNGTDADVFENLYRDVVKQLLADNIKLLLVTPAVISEKNDHSNPADDELDAYASIIKKIAADYALAICDMRTLFMQYEQENNHSNDHAGLLTTDGVHLSEAGNKFAADAIWKVLKDI